MYGQEDNDDDDEEQVQSDPYGEGLENREVQFLSQSFLVETNGQQADDSNQQIDAQREDEDEDENEDA